VTYDIFLQPVPAHGVGTGVIIDRKGYILTNNHVVENAKNIKVILFNGKAYDAKTANRDPYSDLAVVQISADGLEPADLGNSRDLLVGEGVVAVGNALALEGGPTVTAGIVSYIGRSIDIGSDEVLHDLIQTDAAINPGNSGGPLLNLAGQVIGVNTATAASGQNIGFAIAITPAMPIVQQLVRTGFISRPYLGLQLFTFDNGVAIIAVDKGSPAEKAGLLRGDIIAFCEGKPVATAGEMNDIVNSTAIGQSIKITFVRDGKEMQASAVLTNCPSK
jgi:serine protease Do